MKESEKDNINDIDEISTNNEEMFYFSQSDLIPYNIKEDFKTKQNFLLIFVNPRSGSQQGRIVLEHAKKYRIESISGFDIISFPIKDENFSHKNSKELESNISNNGNSSNNQHNKNNYSAKFDPSVEFSAIIFNLIDKDEVAKGIKFIKKYLKDLPNNKIKILAAGGDGTTLGLVEDLKKQGVPLERCIFATIPFGTGNDLSNSLGFGGECKVGGIRNFQRVLYTYIIATIGKIDVWEVSVKLDSKDGGMYEMINKREQFKKDSENNLVKIFKKTFVNYFSMGYDARVGYTFEPKRTSKRCYNRCLYCLIGADRIFCCKKNYGLTDLLDSFQEGTENSNAKEESSSNIYDIEEVRSEPLLPNNEKEDLLTENIFKKCVFKTKNSGDLSTKTSNIVLKGNPVSIICQNIFYYMGGSQNIWEKSSHIGTTQEEISKSQYEQYKKQVFDNFKKQQFDDKKLEIFTYENAIEFGFEKVYRGLANRVYQGKGPFFLEFKKNPDAGEREGLENIFLNLDGEYYHVKNPLQISIRLNTDFCDGQINILRNEKGL